MAAVTLKQITYQEYVYYQLQRRVVNLWFIGCMESQMMQDFCSEEVSHEEL